jgi:DNA-binding MarR family transcriptional regulator
MKPTSNQRTAVKAGVDGFRLEDFLPYRLSVASNRVARLFAQRYSEAYGISIPEWRVVAVIGQFGTLSPSAVGECTAMDKVKVSRAAASLVGRGLLKQVQDPHDGRGRLLSLTRKGVAVYQGVVPLARELESGLANALNRTEWVGLQKALSRLNAYLGELDGPDMEID